MKHLITIGFVTFSIFTFGQINFDNYSLMQSEGEMPKDFFLDFDSLYQQNAKAKSEFTFDINYSAQKVLHSGYTIYGDPISNYVSSVAKVLLNNDKLYNELRFYTIKSRKTNAFSTDQGMIFVTTGLIAQLENEAQLATVLAHEITHYTEHHVREEYRFKEAVVNLNNDADNASVLLNKFSKESEFNADEGAVKMALNAGYSSFAIQSTFDVLLYSYLPFELVEFDTTYFNSEYMELNGMITQEINKISAVEDYNDQKSSHPNIRKRREKVLKSFEGKKDSKVKFKLSKERFEEIREAARFETYFLSTLKKDFSRSIYEGFLLSKKFPSSNFIAQTRVKNWYGLLKIYYESDLRKFVPYTRNVEGDESRVTYFVNELSKQQISVLSLRVSQDLLNQFPENEEILTYRNLILKTVLKEKTISFTDYYPYTYKDAQDSLTVWNSKKKEEKVEVGSSKYDRIKSKKSEPKEIQLDDQFKFFLSDFIADDVLIDLRKKLVNEIRNEPNNIYALNNKSTRNRDRCLGVDSVVLLPSIFKYDSRLSEDESVNSIEYNDKIKFNTGVVKYTDQLGFSVVDFSKKNYSKNSTETFNMNNKLMMWVNDIMQTDSEGMETILNIDVVKDKFNRHPYMLLPVVFTSNNKMKGGYSQYHRNVYDARVYTNLALLVLDVDKSNITQIYFHSKKGSPKLFKLEFVLYDFLNKLKTNQNEK